MAMYVSLCPAPVLLQSILRVHVTAFNTCALVLGVRWRRVAAAVHEISGSIPARQTGRAFCFAGIILACTLRSHALLEA